jgi:hypothetical protein
MSANNIEAVVARLSSADSGELFSGESITSCHWPQLWSWTFTKFFFADVKLKAEAASQLRDNLEHYISGPLYPAFLKKLVPIFLNCLKGPPVFISTSPEQVCASHYSTNGH